MHRQGRSPKGSGLFVFMGRAAEGMGTAAIVPCLHLRLVTEREGIPFLSP